MHRRVCEDQLSKLDELCLALWLIMLLVVVDEVVDVASEQLSRQIS